MQNSTPESVLIRGDSVGSHGWDSPFWSIFLLSLLKYICLWMGKPFSFQESSSWSVNQFSPLLGRDWGLFCWMMGDVLMHVLIGRMLGLSLHHFAFTPLPQGSFYMNLISHDVITRAYKTNCYKDETGSQWKESHSAWFYSSCPPISKRGGLSFFQIVKTLHQCLHELLWWWHQNVTIWEA